MVEYISTELKSDLLNMYKKSGDLLDLLEEKCMECKNPELKETLELIKFRLMDITGTLQKDIFNCDYIISKAKLFKS